MSFTLHTIINEEECTKELLTPYVTGFEYKFHISYSQNLIQAIIKHPHVNLIVTPWIGDLYSHNEVKIAVHFHCKGMNTHGWANIASVSIIDPEGPIKIQNAIKDVFNWSYEQVKNHIKGHDWGCLV